MAEKKVSKPNVINCPQCGANVEERWDKCPECGAEIKLRSHTYYPLQGKKEYLICSFCNKPIKEEESYYDKLQKVFLHLRCKAGFMKQVSRGEVDRTE